MKEFDLDSYQRKWRGTCGIFTTAKNERQQGSFSEFFELHKGILGAEITTRDRKEIRVALETKFEDLPVIKIEYYPVASGWYPHDKGYALLVRKHVRGFSQGLCQNNHDLTVYCDGRERPEWARYMEVDFLRRPEYTKLDPDKNFGVMSQRVWWKDGMIYFLNRAIGCLRGHRVMLENRAFIPYIKPLLEDTCQIVL